MEWYHHIVLTVSFKLVGFSHLSPKNVDCCETIITIFYSCCFWCVIVSLTGTKKPLFFCNYILCFIAIFSYRTKLVGKQVYTMSHLWYIISASKVSVFITTWCYSEHSIATASRLSLSICQSFHNVEVPLSHRLEFFKNNFVVGLGRSLLQTPTSRICSKGNTLKFCQE